MADPNELQEKFWKALKSDRTVMLGLDGVEDGHARPMTAQIEGDSGGPIWFFTSKDNALIAMLGQGRRVIGAFSSKGHDLFASISGSLREDTDQTVIERLWNPYVAVGTKVARTIRSWRCCAWMPITPRFGSMSRACWRGSRCCWA